MIKVYVLQGGPGLSSNYMEKFCDTISLRFPLLQTSLSPTERHWNKLSVRDFSSFIQSIANEIKADVKDCSWAVIGHSFGGHVALALARSLTSELGAPDFVCLLNMSLNGSSTFLKKRLLEKNIHFSQVTTGEGFRAAWKNALPLYFGRSLSRDEEDVLMLNTDWMNALRILQGKPAGQELLAMIPNEVLARTVFYAGMDPVLGDNDIQMVRAQHPLIQVIESNDINHFEILSSPIELANRLHKAILSLI